MKLTSLFIAITMMTPALAGCGMTACDNSTSLYRACDGSAGIVALADDHKGHIRIGDSLDANLFWDSTTLIAEGQEFPFKKIGDKLFIRCSDRTMAFERMA